MVNRVLSRLNESTDFADQAVPPASSVYGVVGIDVGEIERGTRLSGLLAEHQRPSKKQISNDFDPSEALPAGKP